MNTIKNALKKFWRGLKNIFGFSTIESVDTKDVEVINKCDCEKTGSNFDNSNCNCQCETYYDEKCKCDCHNKDINDVKKELNPVEDKNQITINDIIEDIKKELNPVEDKNQITINDIIEEKTLVEPAPIKVYYSDDTITRDILIEELRKNGVTGISRLKRAELLAKFHEMNLEFPEVK